MALLVLSLYLLCFLLLAGMMLFVLSKNPRSNLAHSFAFSALALLAWIGTLFLFNHQASPDKLLLLGRLNFTAALFIVFFGYHLVLNLAGTVSRWKGWLAAETLLLSALTLLTPLIDRAEVIQGSEHVTHFGLLFPLYVLHLLAYLAAMVFAAFAAAHHASGERPSQLRLIGGGILAMSLVALTTNLLLPYTFHVFALQDVGALSTLLFVLAVGYAIFAHHLFNIHVIVRATFVFAGLVTLALEVYQLALGFLVHLLPFGDPTQRNLAATVIALTVNAFTHEPLKRGLEKVVDRLSRQGQPRHRNPR